MKTTKRITLRIEFLEEMLAELKEEKKREWVRASDNIRESADDPMYVASRIHGWTSEITNLTDRIEKLETEIEILKWVL